MPPSSSPTTASSWLGSPALAYSAVFALEGLLFLVATVLALRVIDPARRGAPALAAPAQAASGQGL